MNRETVELVFMKRTGTEEFYFEVWVRSLAKPEIRRGTIVERDTSERKIVQYAAAAIAESLCEAYGDDRDPGEVWHEAGLVYDRLILNNPIPKYGDEEKLV